MIECTKYAFSKHLINKSNIMKKEFTGVWDNL